MHQTSFEGSRIRTRRIGAQEWGLGFLGNEWTVAKTVSPRPKSANGLNRFSQPLRTGSANTQPLVNCTTINWFSEWPREALLEVAEKYLMGADLGPRRTWGPPPHLLNPCTPTHFRSPLASTPALSHNFYALISDPQESGPDLRQHALVSGHIFPEDAVGTSKTQLCHTH